MHGAELVILLSVDRTADESIERTFRVLRIVAIGFSASLSTLSLIGWVFGLDLFSTIMPGTPTMRPLNAVSLLLMSGIMLCLSNPKNVWKRAGKLFSAIVLVSSIAILFEYAIWGRYEIQQFAPAPETALCLMSLSFASFLLFFNQTKFRHAAEILSLFAGGLAIFSITGHITSADVLHGIFSHPALEGMAVHTAFAIISLNLALLLLSPPAGFAYLLTANTAGGTLTRKILPLLFFAPIGVEIIATIGAKSGIFDPSVRHAFSLILLLAIFLSAVWIAAKKLDQIDRERDQSVKLLKLSEQKYRQTVEHAPVGLFTANLNGIYTDVNRAGCELLELPREEIINHTIEEFIAQEDIPRLLESRALLNIPGRVNRSEWKLFRRDGTPIPIEVSETILPDGRWQRFVRDLREQKRAEALTRLKDAQLDAFFDSSPAGLALLDTNLRYLKINRNLAEINGPSVDDHIGHTVQEVLPELAPSVLPQFQKIRHTKRGILNVELQGRTAKAPGTERSWITSYFPIIGPDGEIAYFGAYVVEITALKQAQSALQKQSEDIRAYASEVQDLYDNAPCGYHSLNPKGTYIQINQTELNWLGYQRDEIIHRMNFKDLLTPDSQAKFEKSFPIFLEQGLVQNIKFEMLKKSGEVFPVILNATVIKDRHGHVLMTRSSVFDNSSQKKLEDDLQAALRARDEFISIAAHDLRTPLTSISLQIQLLQRASRESISIREAIAKNLTTGKVFLGSIDQLIDRAASQTERLSTLMNDLLDLTRIRIGKLSLKPSAIDLVSAVTDCITSVRADLDNQGIKLTLSGEHSIMGVWDKQRIDQVVTNLLSNAIKYGKGRPIDIDIRLSADQNTAILRVRDQGIGIPHELQEKVFERYERAVGERNIAGLGLGLYITKRVVQAHGGRISVESTPHQGSVFTVELPRNLRMLKRTA